jgi:hypothetical protein
MTSNQNGNPDTARFRFVYHKAEKALPGMPSTRRPGWWEVLDRLAYPGEDTDTLGFVSEGFPNKADAVKYAKARYAVGDTGSKSILTLK